MRCLVSAIWSGHEIPPAGRQNLVESIVCLEGKYLGLVVGETVPRTLEIR